MSVLVVDPSGSTPARSLISTTLPRSEHHLHWLAGSTPASHPVCANFCRTVRTPGENTGPHCENDYFGDIYIGDPITCKTGEDCMPSLCMSGECVPVAEE